MARFGLGRHVFQSRFFFAGTLSVMTTDVAMVSISGTISGGAMKVESTSCMAGIVS